MQYSRTAMELISAFSQLIDMEEGVKLHHARRTAALASLMANEINREITPLVVVSGFLHDIGGVGHPDHLIHYPDLAQQMERPHIRGHATRGAQILESCPCLAQLAPGVLEHHEYWDGRGYPRGLRGEEISLVARILRLADAADLYFRQEQASLGRVINQIRGQAGREFDPQLSEMMVELLTPQRWQALVDPQTLAGVEQEMLASISQEIPPNPEELEGVSMALANVIDAKHAYTAGHSQRVAEYTVAMAKEMNLPSERLKMLFRAGLLHDLGKVTVPLAILDKPGRLTPGELAIIKEHPRQTIDVLKAVTGLEELGWIGGLHHERWDGKGYPMGLRAEEIPLESRLMAIADAYDAMTSHRPYQPNRTPAEAIKRLQENAGTQFDPSLIPIASRVLGSYHAE